MESSTYYSTSFDELCLQHDPMQGDQQASYFPTLWQNSPPVDFSLCSSEDQVMLVPCLTSTESVSLSSHIRSPSESSSEAFRRYSQEPPTAGVSIRQPAPLSGCRDVANCGQKRDRRRAQNRAAQRAYRERKEQLRQELELQVKKWQDKHQALRESYVDQAQEVQRLKQHIGNLQMQLLAAQDTKLPDNSNFSDFDVWPGFDWKAT